MKSHRRLSSPENPVNFIKIILSDETGSTGLRLPDKFTNEYGKYLPQRVTLKVPNGDLWQVDLQKSGNEIWLKNGWGEVVERYGLGVSSLLMFKYEGLSTFDVVIFNASASEIEYPKNTKKRCSIRTSVKRDARKRSVSCDESKIIVLDDDDDTSSDSTRREDQEHATKINDEGEFSTNTQRMEEGRRTIEKAKASFKSDKPLFMVSINELHFTNRGVFLPVEMRRILSRGSKNRNCLLQLENNGKFWKVAAQNRYLGSVDWLMFVKDSGVKVGDICVFELSHKDKKVFSVTILRS
ncbi:B3 domain-containing protein At5g18000-like [Bidens hawaiensis]|uniref:B3 domain-containing protein At5g18000-like n=1 Tax=Bidens hawaiensis TaxID=980011 RepID=UPI004049F602